MVPPAAADLCTTRGKSDRLGWGTRPYRRSSGRIDPANPAAPTAATAGLALSARLKQKRERTLDIAKTRLYLSF